MAVVKRTNKAKFKIRARFDLAGGDQEGFLIIDPTLNTITAKPFGKQRSYTKSLREVADWICTTTMLGK